MISTKFDIYKCIKLANFIILDINRYFHIPSKRTFSQLGFDSIRNYLRKIMFYKQLDLL